MAFMLLRPVFPKSKNRVQMLYEACPASGPGSSLEGGVSGSRLRALVATEIHDLSIVVHLHERLYQKEEQSTIKLYRRIFVWPA